MAAGTALVYFTGGLKFVYSHFMYLPIVLGGFLLGRWGGLLTGLVAGLLLGPLMPLETATGQMQNIHAWLYRMFFFCLVGFLSGHLARLTGRGRDDYGQIMSHLGKVCARTLQSFAMTIAAKDKHTGGHCDRVAYNARVVGEELGYQGKMLEELFWSGLLHDLGKIGVREDVLLKPGRLTRQEFDHIKIHSIIGHQLVEGISPAFAEIALGVRHHHERWDGKGYPDGLAGEQIPLFGRILAVVDVFEALTTTRPYREPMPAERALTLVQSESGRHFDPIIVDAFARVFHRGRICSGNDESIIRYERSFEFDEETLLRCHMRVARQSRKTKQG